MCVFKGSAFQPAIIFSEQKSRGVSCGVREGWERWEGYGLTMQGWGRRTGCYVDRRRRGFSTRHYCLLAAR